MKKVLSILIIILLSIYVLSGCIFIPRNKMPFNGNIQFHDIKAVIPDDFIRDSTQSNEDMWIFEKGSYRKYIIIQRSDIKTDVDTDLDDYVQLMLERGADSSRGKFLNVEAVLTTYYLDDLYCQEILFVYNDMYYAFTLRGGTEEEFQSLLNDLNTPDTIENTDTES